MIQVTKGLKCLCRYPDLSIVLCQDGEVGFIVQTLQLDASSWACLHDTKLLIIVRKTYAVFYIFLPLFASFMAPALGKERCMHGIQLTAKHMVIANYSKRQKSIEFEKKWNQQQTNKKNPPPTPCPPHPSKKPTQTQQQRNHLFHFSVDKVFSQVAR